MTASVTRSASFRGAASRVGRRGIRDLVRRRDCGGPVKSASAGLSLTEWGTYGGFASAPVTGPKLLGMTGLVVSRKSMPPSQPTGVPERPPAAWPSRRPLARRGRAQGGRAPSRRRVAAVPGQPPAHRGHGRARPRRSRFSGPTTRERRGSSPRPRSPAAACTWGASPASCSPWTSQSGQRLWAYETGAEIGESSPCVSGGRSTSATSPESCTR